jgi:hypothetical protein
MYFCAVEQLQKYGRQMTLRLSRSLAPIELVKNGGQVLARLLCFADGRTTGTLPLPA